LKNEDKKNAAVTVLNAIERKYSADSFPGMISAAYVLWLAQKDKVVDIVNLTKFIYQNESYDKIRTFINDRLKNHWEEYRRYITAFDQETLEEVILSLSRGDSRANPIENTPDCILKLVYSILKIQKNDSVGEFGTGYGKFLFHAFNQEPQASYWGNEISTDASVIAMIKSVIVSHGKIRIVQEDIFGNTEAKNQQFDKIYCFPPANLRTSLLTNARSYLAKQSPSLPEIKGNVSSEWVFMLKMQSCLKASGRAVMLTYGRPLFNQLDNEIRKYFLWRKMIEAVIQLPGRILNMTNIAPVLIVFNTGDDVIQRSEKIHMIDASSLGEKMNRNTVLRDKDVTQIIDALNGVKKTWHTLVDYRDLICHGDMTPSLYLHQEIKVPYAKPFNDVVKQITRGAMISSSEIDELLSEKYTPYHYLTISNINNGMVDDNLPCLKEIKEKHKRYCITSRSIVLGKNGTPSFKVAVVEPKKGQIILAHSNLYIISINEEVANPYYINAFLNSETGAIVLNQIAQGIAIKSLSLQALRDMSIPVPSMEEQNKIAALYQAEMDKVAFLKQKMEKALASLKNFEVF